MEQGSTFLTYVRYVLKKWAGFQAAIVEGMGGPDAKEKELWLGTEVENYFKRYDEVEPEDIADYIGAMLENEFETYFEDGSLEEVCKKFCEAYPLSLSDPDAEIFQDMKKKPKANLLNSSADPAKSTQENNEESTREKLEQLTFSKNAEDDGWTTVTRKSKHK